MNVVVMERESGDDAYKIQDRVECAVSIKILLPVNGT